MATTDVIVVTLLTILILAHLATLAMLVVNSRRTRDLWEWHNIKDPTDPSRMLWYFPVSLTLSITGLTEKIEELIDRIDKQREQFEKWYIIQK